MLIGQWGGHLRGAFETILQQESAHELLFITTNPDTEKLKEVMAHLWMDYKMINVMVLTLDIEEHEMSIGNPDALDHDDLEFTIYIYHPFIMHNDIRGKAFNYTINEHNYEIQSAEIRKLYRERILDLHQYPMKIFMIEIAGHAKVIKYENGLPSGINHSLVFSISLNPLMFLIFWKKIECWLRVSDFPNLFLNLPKVALVFLS